MRAFSAFSVAAVLVLLLASAATAGTTYYVDAAAPPGGDGSQAAPFKYMQDGIVAAASGDTVQVAQGTYNEHIDFLTKNITVQSSDPDNPAVVAATIIHGSDSGTCVTISGGQTAAAVLAGFTITHGNWPDLSVSGSGGVYILNSSPTIRKNVITLNHTASDGGGISVGMQSAPLIENNVISVNTADFWGGGIIVYGEVDLDGTVIHQATPTIRSNRISGNHAEWDGGGLACFEAGLPAVQNNVVAGNTSGQVGGGLFYGWDVANVTASGNTIADNQAQGTSVGSPPQARVGRGGGVACYQSGSVTVTNAILWGNTAKNNEGNQLSLERGSTLTVNFSDVQGGQAAVFIETGSGIPVSTLNWGTGVGNVDPLFAGSGDYHLKSKIGRYDPSTGAWVVDAVASPCIDVGNPTSAYGNEPQPNGQQINLGAYGNTAEASMSGKPLAITVSNVEGDWVYQNAPITTLDAHKITLNIAVTSDPNLNSNYFVQVTKVGGTGDVTIASTASRWVWHVVGSRHGVGSPGPADLKVRVYGDIGGAAEAADTVTVRLLGDIDQDNGVNAQDKAQITRKLNGLPVTYTDRSFDLNADGFVNAQDKAVITKILNGLPVD